jgi:hypothetical protein
MPLPKYRRAQPLAGQEVIIMDTRDWLATLTEKGQIWQRRNTRPEACSYAIVTVRKRELPAGGSSSKPSPSVASGAAGDAYATAQGCLRTLEMSIERMIVHGGAKSML